MCFTAMMTRSGAHPRSRSLSTYSQTTVRNALRVAPLIGWRSVARLARSAVLWDRSSKASSIEGLPQRVTPHTPPPGDHRPTQGGHPNAPPVDAKRSPRSFRRVETRQVRRDQISSRDVTAGISFTTGLITPNAAKCAIRSTRSATPVLRHPEPAVRPTATCLRRHGRAAFSQLRSAQVEQQTAG